MVYVTRGLLDALLDFAEDAEPERFVAALEVTPAGEFADLDLPSDTPVFTHFYHPAAGDAVNAVFGIDLSTPVGRTSGRFVSHPTGGLSVDRSDDLHEVVVIAVPPWDETSVGAFDRRGQRQRLDVVEAEPPEESL